MNQRDQRAEDHVVGHVDPSGANSRLMKRDSGDGCSRASTAGTLYLRFTRAGPRARVLGGRVRVIPSPQVPSPKPLCLQELNTLLPNVQSEGATAEQAELLDLATDANAGVLARECGRRPK